MKKLPALLLAMILVLTISCSKMHQDIDEVKIRVENTSVMKMNNIEVQFPNKLVDYGHLLPDESSQYQIIDEAFSTAKITTTVEGKEILFQPIDFIGEDLLEPGFYTYVLRINEEMFNSSDTLDQKFSLQMELKNNTE